MEPETVSHCKQYTRSNNCLRKIKVSLSVFYHLGLGYTYHVLLPFLAQITIPSSIRMGEIQVQDLQDGFQLGINQ